MDGEHGAELLLLLLLEYFVPERLQYSTTHSIGVFWSYISTDWIPHSICSLADCFIGFEDLMTIQELFLKLDSILRNPITVDLQYTTKNNTVAASYITGDVTSFYIKPTIKISVIDYC